MNAGKPYAMRVSGVEARYDWGTNTKRPRRCVNTVIRGLADYQGVD